MSCEIDAREITAEYRSLPQARSANWTKTFFYRHGVLMATKDGTGKLTLVAAKSDRELSSCVTDTATDIDGLQKARDEYLAKRKELRDKFILCVANYNAADLEGVRALFTGDYDEVSMDNFFKLEEVLDMIAAYNTATASIGVAGK